MKKWEYFFLTKSYDKNARTWKVIFVNKEDQRQEYRSNQITALFNNFGKGGWELICVDSYIEGIWTDGDWAYSTTRYYFKRELEEK